MFGRIILDDDGNRVNEGNDRTSVALGVYSIEINLRQIPTGLQHAIYGVRQVLENLSGQINNGIQ